MPIYEYRCGSCEHVFEELTTMGAAAPPCPECGKASERQLSGVSVGGPKQRVGTKAQLHDAKRSAEKAAASKKD